MKRRIQFAAATGLRASEQWALRWRHIDLKARTVTVDSRVDAFGQFDTTKTYGGKRTVPLGRTIVSDLLKWKSASKHSGADAFIFPAPVPGFTRHTTFLRLPWNPSLDAAMSNNTGWHSLRHFAVSTWIEAGLQPKAADARRTCNLRNHHEPVWTSFPQAKHCRRNGQIARRLPFDTG